MKTVEDLQHFLIQTFPDAKIYLFGSRARGEASTFSDIDIAIDSPHDIHKKLSLVRFAIEESSLSHKVDLVELAKAPYLHDIVKNEGVRWH